LGLLAALEAEHGDARRSLEAIREQITTSVLSRYFLASNLYIGLRVFNRVSRADLVALCDGHCRQLGVAAPAFYAKFHEDSVQDARKVVGDEAFERNAGIGAAMPPEEFNDMIVREIDDLLAAMPPE